MPSLDSKLTAPAINSEYRRGVRVSETERHLLTKSSAPSGDSAKKAPPEEQKN